VGGVICNNNCGKSSVYIRSNFVGKMAANSFRSFLAILASNVAANFILNITVNFKQSRGNTCGKIDIVLSKYLPRGKVAANYCI
jgi:hypothetical protein